MRIVPVVLAAAALSACTWTWTDLTPSGEKVRLLTEEEVAKCQKMGNVKVVGKAKVAGLEVRPKLVQDELNRVARNSAEDLKGDTVAPLAPPVDGTQTFGVYRCMPQ